MNRDLKSSVHAAISFPPLLRTATGTGTAVDVRDYDSAFVYFYSGTVATGGTFVPTLTDSADGTTYAAVAAADLAGTFATVDPAGGGESSVGYIGNKRYIKPVLTFTGTGAGASCAMVVLRGHPNRQPL